MEQVQIQPNGYPFVVGHPYSPSEASGAIVAVVVAVLELISSIGLLSAILLSAFSTRSSNEPHLFVRTHSAIFFVCLVICTVFQALGGILTSTWIRAMGVQAGAACTTQAVIKHVSDVGIALWSLVIAVYSFRTLWKERGLSKASNVKHDFLGYEMSHGTVLKWAVVAFTWFMLGAIVVLGPEITTDKENGDFYGVSGEWCWITDGYLPERVIFAYGIMIASAFASLGLYIGAFYHNRKKLRVDKPGSEYILSDEDQADEYALKLSRYMVWYPLAYFCCFLPIAILRFVYWSGVEVPFGATVFTDTVYHCLGIVNTILFVCTPKLLPPLTIFPKLFSSDSYEQSRADSYANPQHRQEKRFAGARRPPPLQLAVPAPVHAAQDPFSTPLYDDKSQPLQREKKATLGLPARPGMGLGAAQLPPAARSPSARSHVSFASDEKDMSDADDDDNDHLESLPYTHQAPRQPAGLPAHPAAPVRGTLNPFTVPSHGAEKSSWSLTTGSTATATLNLGTAYARSEASSVSGRARRTAVPESAMSGGASPLTGAVFQMVTQPEMYGPQGHGESIKEESKDGA